MDLIIVESPTKARTIKNYLGKGYKVLSSYGHVRDLPKTKLGIDTKNDYQPKYRVFKKSRKPLGRIRKSFKKADNLYLATDLDREGEAIAWHLTKALDVDSNDKKVKRITFDEITKSSIKKAVKNPRKIDKDLVDAQQARRIIDRLVGYKLSPFLWKKVARGLSAGRVQSVAVRLVVEQERKIEDFDPKKYWKIKAILLKGKNSFPADLFKIDSKKIKSTDINKKKRAEKIKKDLKDAGWKVKNIRKKDKKKQPYPPYTTSSLQRDSAVRLKFSSKKTMYLAQKLYEGVDMEKDEAKGLITYMRTDSLNLAKSAVGKARKYIKKNHSDSLPKKPRFFKTKSKTAQEAHEAIRPTDPNLPPKAVKKHLSKDQFKLYELIFKRMIACQMKPLKYRQMKVDIKAGDKYIFRSTGRVIQDSGFSKVYKVKFKQAELPKLKEKDDLNLDKLKVTEKETQPPKQYSESSLIKELEKRGIGRPSTYAPIISTIQDRNYVEKQAGYFHPTEIGEVVNDLLVENFSRILDYKFTAKIESDLDKIARGKKDWTKVVDKIYQPFIKRLKRKEKEVKKEDVSEEKLDEKCPECGAQLVKKMGRFGKFVACSNYPDCDYSRPAKDSKKKKKNQLTKKEKKKGKEFLKKHEKCDKCGVEMEIKKGRFGIFLGCSNFPKCKNIIPIPQKTGQKCPECRKGDVVIKRTKKGKKFWGCSRYPKCDWASWQKPDLE